MSRFGRAGRGTREGRDRTAADEARFVHEPVRESPADVRAFQPLDAATTFNVVAHGADGLVRSVRSAAELRIYAYDAYILEAARASGFPLLTLDGPIQKNARKLGLSLVELDL